MLAPCPAWALPLQGTFSEAVSFEDALTGQEFAHAFQNVPASLLIQAAAALIRRLSPSAEAQQVRLACHAQLSWLRCLGCWVHAAPALPQHGILPKLARPC